MRAVPVRVIVIASIPLTVACILISCPFTTRTRQAFAQSYNEYLNKRVEVILKEGQTLDGVIDQVEDDRIHLKRRYGQLWLRADQIQEIKVLRDPLELYREKAAAAKTADDWVELAKWCKRYDIGLKKQSQECLDKAIELDADHKEARQMRGDMKVDGKWLDEETAQKKLGRVKYKGRWISKKDYERQKKRDALKKNKHVKNLLEQMEAREGRPWATVEAIETTNFYVKCNSTEDVAKEYSQVMEDLYDAYDSLFSEVDFPRYLDEKGQIYIFRNHDEFMDFTLAPNGVGGYYSHLDRAVRAYHGSFGVTGSTEMVLAHEATHQFQGMILKNMRAVPVWLIEGMAVYYGDGTKFERSGVKLHEIPRDRLQSLKDSIRTGRYRTLPQLLRTPQWGFGPFYDHGWGVIYWCLQGEKHGAHKGEGKQVWDAYLQHVSKDLPSIHELGNLGKHYDDEANYFQKLLLQKTGYDSVESWEKAYKDFIANKLELEALGQWKGNVWDGSKKVGIKLTFPKGKLNLKVVKPDDLRAEYREAAALASSNDLRVWVSVGANWSEKSGPEEAVSMVTAHIGGTFKNPEWVEGEKPKAADFQGVGGISIVRAKFKGRFQHRKERVTGGGRRPEGDKGDEPKEKPKAAAPENRPDPKKVYTVKVAYIVTTDKLYAIAMAGEDGPIARLEPSFENLVDSVKLSFD